MNKHIVTVFVLPLLRTLIDKYVSQFDSTEKNYYVRIEMLYNFYEWIYRESNNE